MNFASIWIRCSLVTSRWNGCHFADGKIGCDVRTAQQQRLQQTNSTSAVGTTKSEQREMHGSVWANGEFYIKNKNLDILNANFPWYAGIIFEFLKEKCISIFSSFFLNIFKCKEWEQNQSMFSTAKSNYWERENIRRCNLTVKSKRMQRKWI